MITILACLAIALACLILLTIGALIAHAIADAVERRIDRINTDHEMIQGNPQ